MNKILKYFLIIIGVIFIFLFIFGIFSNDKKEQPSDHPDKYFESDVDWNSVKENAKPVIELTDEFNPPELLSISNLGWEDGIHISRDGLNLYCIYLPADSLSMILNGDIENSYLYRRGPAFEMDLSTNPTGEDVEWIHGDILYSHRNSISEKFLEWQLTGISKSIFSEGAPNPLFSDSENVEIFAFTSNNKPPTYDTDIWYIRNTNKNPSGTGKPFNDINTGYNEDNPHIEKVDDKLILFFDSDNRPGGKGSHDIWYSVSEDNGESWSEPSNDVSINSAKQEHQPHLYKKDDTWYLYYSKTLDDGKLGIFRTKQKNKDDWTNWIDEEVVVSAGNTQGVGDPTLTDRGDLYFVVVYQNPLGTKYDKYDADPWKANAK